MVVIYRAEKVKVKKREKIKLSIETKLNQPNKVMYRGLYLGLTLANHRWITLAS